MGGARAVERVLPAPGRAADARQGLRDLARVEREVSFVV
jgi:hypothetical protein